MNRTLNALLCLFIALIFLIPPANAADVTYSEDTSPVYEPVDEIGIQDVEETPSGSEMYEREDKPETPAADDGSQDAEAYLMAPDPNDPAAGRRHESNDEPNSGYEDENPVDTEIEIKGAAMSISKVSLHYANGTPTESLDHGADGSISAKVTNEGRETDYMTDVEVEFYYLNEEGRRTFIGAANIEVIKGGGHSEVAEVNWTATMLATDIYVIADPDGSDGGPAEFTKEITINPADYFQEIYCPYPYGADVSGEDIEYWIKIDNVGSNDDTVQMEFDMITGSASWKAGYGEDQDSTKQYDLDSGDHTWISFVVSIPSSGDKEDEAVFELSAYSTEGDYYVSFLDITTFVRADTPILVVDDDESNGNPNTPWCETNRYMVAALNDAGLEGMFDQVNGGNSAPTYATMSDYDLVIWSTGYDWTGDIITQNNRGAMQGHMEDGNSVWINGENFFQAGQTNGEPDYGKIEDEFWTDWMNATWVRQNIGSPDYITGQLGDPISDSALYITNEVHTPPQMICDEVWNEDDEWAEPFFDSGGAHTLGIHNQWMGGNKEYDGDTEYANPYRSVIMGTGLETIGKNVFQRADGSWGDSDRTDVTSKVVSWLGVPAPFHGKYDLAPHKVTEPLDLSLTTPDKTTDIKVQVANFGQVDFEGYFEVDFRIRDLSGSGYGSYDEEWTVEIDMEDESTIITAQGVAYPGYFLVETEWDVPDEVNQKYEIQVTVNADGDTYSGNDMNMSYVIAREQKDTAILSLESEKRCGYWGFGLVGTPAHITVEVKNNGSATEDISVYLSVKDPFGNELRNWTQTHTLVAGEMREYVWKWTPEKAAGIASATHPSYRNWVEDPYSFRTGTTTDEDDWLDNNHIGTPNVETYRFCAVEYQTGAEESSIGWSFINKQNGVEFDNPNIWWDSEMWSYLDPSHGWTVASQSSVAAGVPRYDNNVFGEAHSPIIDLTPYFSVYFDIIYAGQTQNTNDWESIQVKTVYEDWDDAQTLWNRSGNYQGGYLTNGINLGSRAGELINMRFVFRSDGATSYQGIHVDNIILMAAAEDYFDADIKVQSLTVDPLVDDAGEERTIRAEIKNVGEIETNEEGKVEVEVTVKNSEGYEIDITDARQEIRDNIKREESVVVEWFWTPDENGVYMIDVVAEWTDGNGDSIDEDISDNNLTIEALVQHYYFVDDCESAGDSPPYQQDYRPEAPDGTKYDSWEVVLVDSDGSGDIESTPTWEVGMPDTEYDFGPRSAPSPNLCWGTNLAGAYEKGGKDSEALMQLVDLRIAKQPYLMFNHWLEIEASYDYAYVEIREYSEAMEDEDWTILWNNPDEVDNDYYRTDDWESMQINLEDWAFKLVQIRFRLMSDVSTTYAGWYLDDIAVSGIAPHKNDLRAIEISSPVHGESDAPGTTINIAGSITNIGSQSKQRRDVEVKFTIDKYWGETKQATVREETLGIDGNLDSGDSADVNFNWKVQNIGEGGDLFFRITMEAVMKNVADDDMENNFQIVDIFPRQLHNMTITDIYGSPRIQDVGRPRILTAEVVNNGNVEQDFFVTFTVLYDDDTALADDVVAENTVVGSLLPGESGQVTWNWTGRKYATYTLEAEITLPEGEDEFYPEDNIMLAAGDKSLYTRIKILADSSEQVDPVSYENEPWEYMAATFWDGNNVTGSGTAAGWHRVYDNRNPLGFNSAGAWYVGKWPEQRYAANMYSELISTPIDLESEEDVTLSFMTKFYVEGWNYDNLEVWVRNQNLDWNRLDKYPHKHNEPGNAQFDLKDSATYRENSEGWVLKEYSIAEEYIDKGFELKFVFTSDSGTEYDGLFIDDITLHAQVSAKNQDPVSRFLAYSQDNEAYSAGYVDDPEYEHRHFSSLPSAQQEELTHLPREGGIDISSGSAAVLFDATYSYDPDRNDVDLTYEWNFGDDAATYPTSEPTIVHEYTSMPDDGSDYFTVQLVVKDENDGVSDEDTMKVIIGNEPPSANFVIYDIGGTKEKIKPIGEDDDGNMIYEVFWGDTIRFQSEAEDPEHKDEPGRGIADEKWDFAYNGMFDQSFNLSGAAQTTLTVGQNDHFVYNAEKFLTDDGIPVLYDDDDDRWFDTWFKDLPYEYRYLREIIQGNLEDRARVYLPPPPIGTPDAPEYIDYPMRFQAVDDQDATNESVIILRVKPFAQRSFPHPVEDQFGNPFIAEATLTWRGYYEDAATKASNINANTPIFVFVNTTAHPLGLKVDGELGVYYDIDVVGTTTQDPTRFGFCNVTVNLPYSAESLQSVGTAEILKDRVKNYFWQEESYQLIRLEKTKTIPQSGVYFAITTVDDDLIRNNMPMVPLVYTLHDNIDKAQLSVEEIVFSRQPAIPGSLVEITATLRNSGVVHEYGVSVRFSFESQEFSVESADMPAGSTTTVTAMYNISSEQDAEWERFTIKVIVDPQGYISEDDKSDNSMTKDIDVVEPYITVSSFSGGLVAVSISVVLMAALVVLQRKRYLRRNK